ncbi:MAG: hypothetical protein NTW65_11725 [Deltaproteobacteria bacterium]|nr:hypothetical protein [Deltaproteobacteria bacterium]
MRGRELDRKFSLSQVWTVEKLHQLGTSGIVELFKTLSAPVLREMNGEYQGHYFGADNHPISNILWHASANWNLFSGKWQGKSFQPISDTTGYGFNNMKKFGMIVRRWPMKTSIGPSRYDGKEAFALNYGYYYSAAGMVSMQDEIRKIQEGLYLGVGHWRLPVGISMTSVWFGLTGPVGVFDSTGGRL